MNDEIVKLKAEIFDLQVEDAALRAKIQDKLNQLNILNQKNNAQSKQPL